MRLNNFEHRNDLFIEWMIESTPPNCSFLDVGANDGHYCPQVERITRHAGCLVGVDPDREKLARNPFVSERYASTLENADIPPESFDVMYSFFVFEHVINPERFTEAASRVLKPGGSFFFITPNGHHYFSILASTFAKMGIQEEMLRIVRSRRLIDAYHYPAVYRLNRPRDIERIGRKYGFDFFEYQYCERFIELKTYFPGPTKVFPWLWEKAIETSGREDLLFNLMGRMVKKPRS